MVLTKKMAWIIEKENLIRIQYWVRCGYTEKKICEMLGVSQHPWDKAKKYSQDLRDILRNAKDVVDTKVENQLLKRAMGYEYDETIEEYEAGFLVRKKVIHKHMPPDTTAQIWWLKNRRPAEWRDRREVDNTLALEKLDEVLGQIKGCE